MNDFLARLEPFLKKLPKDHRFAVEIRNKTWLVPQFVEALRERGVALALIDQGWMPRPAQWFEKFDPITADFTYVRWLGDRKGIEEQTKVWDKIIVDRSADLAEWVEVLEDGSQAEDSDFGVRQQSLCGVRTRHNRAVQGTLATASADGDRQTQSSGGAGSTVQVKRIP